MLPGDPAMRNMAGLAVFCRMVDRPEHQHLAGMAAQAVVIARLDSGMGLVTFVAI